MATVLVTGVGGASGIGAVRSLHDLTAHQVVGVDMNPEAAGLHLADAGRAIPPATADSWAPEVATVVEEFGVDIIIPTVDEELAELPSLFDTLPADVPVIAPRTSVIDVALDKFRTHQRLQEAGHDVPRTWLASERNTVDESAFPLLIKPRRGRGSRGIQLVADDDELETYLRETDTDPESLLLQEFIEGTEFTTSVVGTRDDQLLGVVPKEAIEKQGSTVTGVTRDSEVISSACRRLFRTLKPGGPMNVQQILDQEGTPYTIEINPRFSSTSCLTAAAGVDEFDLLVRDALGQSVSAPDGFESDLYMRRYEDHLFVPATEFENQAWQQASARPGI